jgi:transglutaminase-like putative cysteine protease
MSWRIAICHRSGYHYERGAASSYNESRITPLTTDRQVVLEAMVSVSPKVPILRYVDYWGTFVDAFDIQEPHTDLVVTGQSVVETSAPAKPVPPIGWDDLAGERVHDRYAELLAPTARVPVSDELAEIARSLVGGLSPLDACDAAAEWVRARLHYEAGATDASTSAIEALRAGRGVCQDFVHLTLAILRAMGIPARYTSGYLHPSPDADVGVTVEGQSHAWLEAWIGDWHAVDPTNGGPVGERHVVVGRARDYADVTPLKGIYHGSLSAALGVSVELTRLDASEPFHQSLPAPTTSRR